ncbi:hypothetical protein JAAARDRAFT_201225 [Jaapia argillacea MUCL 33604]|uniref:Uncharacterized protein n=1 Tax=Jaapia argillacea MUCL 33604 TaxID=933084 RepID=A0A067PDB4_9AGAM|nr:hypothetical protein JAAARDRAFT_201225 [Jaapia argillacea MUCL 33604]
MLDYAIQFKPLDDPQKPKGVSQRNPSTEVSHSTAVDDPMSEQVDNSHNNDILLSPEAMALRQMGMAFTALATAAELIAPDLAGGNAPSLVDTRSHVDDDHN